VVGSVYDSVRRERERQDAKWGEQNHPIEWWYPILLEEVGEVGKAMLEWHLRGAQQEAIRVELIHVAAVAIAAVESLDRASGYIIAEDNRDVEE